MSSRRISIACAAILFLAGGCAHAAQPSPATQSASVTQYNGHPVKIDSDGTYHAINLTSFEGIEEPELIYYPQKDDFRSDVVPNITDVSPGVVRMMLRYQPDAWDGDRDLPNKDRQRAEVKGLGPHQRLGDTFEYTTTFRTNRELVGSERWTHLFQLKATEGDRGAPLVTLTLQKGTSEGVVQIWSGQNKGFQVVRQFHWSPGEWHSARIRIRTSLTDGEVEASIDGDPFAGASHIPIYRPGADDYRPKWGFYRGMSDRLHHGEDWVEHRDITSRRLASAPPTTSAASQPVAPRSLRDD